MTTPDLARQKIARNRAKRLHAKVAATLAERDEAITEALDYGARQVDLAADLEMSHTAIYHAAKRHRERS